MSVQVGFSTSEWWVSRVIRWFTKAKVSHAFLYSPFAELGDVAEAAWCGYRISTLTKLTSGTTRVVTMKTPVVPLKMEIAKQWLDTPYAYAALFGEAWVCIGRLFRKMWKNPFPDPHHMFCSEAIVLLMQQSGYPGADKLDAVSTSPDDLLRFMEEQEAGGVHG